MGEELECLEKRLLFWLVVYLLNIKLDTFCYGNLTVIEIFNIMKNVYAYIVPIFDLTLEKPVKLGKFYLFPSLIDNSDWFYDGYDKLKMNFSQSEYSDMISNVKKFKEEYLLNNMLSFPSWHSNCSYVFFYSDLSVNTNGINQLNNKEVDILLNELNELFDYIIHANEILFHCHELLPFPPGIYRGEISPKVCYKIDFNDSYLFTTDIINLLKPGIGMHLETYEDSRFYKLFFSDRDDEIAKLCKSGMRRLTESLYMPSYEMSFIYLMSTIESLVSSTYMKFQDTKSKMLTLISSSKEIYHEKSKYYYNLSKNVRTDIIHNGKTLYEHYENKGYIKFMLNRLYVDIEEFIWFMFESGALDQKQLDEKLKEKRKIIGIE